MAIFKGVIKENVWHTNDNITELSNLEYNLSLEIRYDGNISKAKEKLRNFERKIKLYEVGQNLKYEEIWRGEISRPVLEVGEEIYINDLDIVVLVTRKYRTTNDEVIYETSHHIKSIDTDVTEDSRLKRVEYWFKELYPSYTTFEQLKSEFITEEVVEEPMEQTGYVPPWEREENKNKENTWFGWFGKKKS